MHGSFPECVCILVRLDSGSLTMDGHAMRQPTQGILYESSAAAGVDNASVASSCILAVRTMKRVGITEQ